MCRLNHRGLSVQSVPSVNVATVRSSCAASERDAPSLYLTWGAPAGLPIEFRVTPVRLSTESFALLGDWQRPPN